MKELTQLRHSKLVIVQRIPRLRFSACDEASAFSPHLWKAPPRPVQSRKPQTRQNARERALSCGFSILTMRYVAAPTVVLPVCG